VVIPVHEPRASIGTGLLASLLAQTCPDFELCSPTMGLDRISTPCWSGRCVAILVWTLCHATHTPLADYPGSASCLHV